MPLLSKSWMKPLLVRLLSIIIILKVAALSGIWFLPVEGVDMLKKENVQPPYQRYSLGNMLETAHSDPTSAGKRMSTAVSGATISNLLLKGLYGSKTKGYAILAMRTAPEKTEVIGISESFGGYTLMEIEPEAARFERHGKSYRLELEGPKGAVAAYRVAPVETFDAVSPIKAVARTDVNFYRQNMDKIWKDIGITELKEGRAITGFKVTRINPSSPFAQLGLRQGDVLVKANNKPLTSYAAAIEIYRSIDTLQALELTIKRNNQEKEIVYEIN